MKKFIIKSNEWYDELPEPKRTLFFLFFVMGSLAVAQFLMYGKNCVFAFPIWAIILWAWRFSYTLIQIREHNKK